MGDLTLTDMLEEVRANIKRTSPGVSDARITRWLNLGQRRCASLHTFFTMVGEDVSLSTATGVATCGYPSGVKVVYSVVLVSGSKTVKLKQLRPRLFEQTFPRRDLARSTPVYYCDRGSSLIFYPLPNAIYPLRLTVAAFPALLSAPTGVSSLTGCDAAIIDYASARGERSLGEPELATTWDAAFAGDLAEAIAGDRWPADWSGEFLGWVGNVEEVPSASNPWVGR